MFIESQRPKPIAIKVPVSLAERRIRKWKAHHDQLQYNVQAQVKIFLIIFEFS
jgi:hypothetical protein